MPPMHVSRLLRVLVTATVAAVVASLLNVASAPAPAAATGVAPSTVVLVSDRAEFVAGDTFTLSATVDQPLQDTAAVLTITDVSNGVDLAQCTEGVACATQVTFISGGPREYVATVGAIESNSVVVARSVWQVDLVTDLDELAAGEVATLTASTNQDLADTGGAYAVAIYDTTTGRRVQTCTSGIECAVAVSAYETPADATQYVAIVLAASDAASTTVQTALDVQASSGPVGVARKTWVLEATVDDDVLWPTEDTTVRVTADQGLDETNDLYSLYVFELSRDVLVAQCDTGVECVSATSWGDVDPSGAFFQAFVARRSATAPASVADLEGVVSSTGGDASVAPADWAIDFEATSAADDFGNSVPLVAGQTATFEATVNQNLSDTEGRYALYIVDFRSYSIVSSCTVGFTCGNSFSFYGPDDSRSIAGANFTAIIAAAGATTMSGMTNWRSVSASREAPRALWDAYLFPTSAHTLTLASSQDVGLTNDRWAWYLFHWGPNGAAREGSCESGTRCVFNVGSFDEGYYVAYLARTTDPSHPSDVQDQFVSVGWGVPSEPGPMPPLPGETVGGGNPAVGPCECPRADPVSTATGEFFLPESDLGVAGVGPALAVQRTYSALRAAQDGPFGYGWSSSFGARLSVLVASDDSNPLPRQLEVTQENGSLLLFTRVGLTSSYESFDRVFATLRWGGVEHEWVLQRRNSEVLRFTEGGDLAALEDSSGNSTEYSYSAGKLIAIVGSGGRAITIAWTGGRISAVSDSAGRSVGYSYDSAGNLETVTAADGSLSSYAYRSDHLMTGFVRPGGGRTSNTFDEEGRVVSQSDPLNRVTTFDYTFGYGQTLITTPDGLRSVDEYADGLLVRQIRAQGTPSEAVTQYYYNAQNLVDTVIDPLAGTVSYTYDGSGNRASQTDQLLRTSTWTYGAHPTPLTYTDPDGRTSTTTLNADGRPLTVEAPGGATQSWTYNPDGTVETFENANGAVSEYVYDAAGRVISVTDADDREISFTYNAYGLLASTTSPGGGTTSTTYDEVGRTVSVEDALGRTTAYVYDQAGRVASVTNGADETTSFTYDAAGQVRTVTDAEGATTALDYDLAGNVTSATDANGNTTTTTHDAFGNPLTTSDPLDRVTTNTYDLAGRLTSTVRPSGATTTYVRDSAGQLIEAVDALSHSTTWTYNGAGQVATVQDALGRVTSTTYDDDGRVAEVELPDGSTQLYGYDPAGNLVSYTNPDAAETTYTYSPTGLLTSRTDPGGMTTEFSYDDDARVAALTRPDNSDIEYGYNAAGELTALTHPGTPADDVTYTYDNAARRVGVTDATGATVLTYDKVGRLASETDGSGDTLTYTYDDGGRLTSIGYPVIGAVDYSYDDADQLTAVTDWADRTTAITWTPDGQVASQAADNGVHQIFDYDDVGRPATITTSADTTEVASFGYAYDAAGQLTEQGTAVGAASRATSFEHDLLGQLNATIRNDGTSATSVPIDASPGGRLNIADDGATLSYNPAQQVTLREPATGPDTTYTYDANGNRITATPTATPTAASTFDYDTSGYLNEVASPAGTVHYQTDARGLRQTRTTATVEQFLWSTVTSISRLLQDGTNYYIYGAGSVPLAQVNKATGEITHLHADALGSIRLTTDDTGTVLGTTTYTEYGSILESTGTPNTPFGYTGNWTDPDTNLIHLRARDYDPTTGQFLSVDPAIDQTRQPYAYAANNPIQLTDHTGRDFLNDILGGLSTALDSIATTALDVGANIAAGAVGVVDAVTFGGYSAIMRNVVDDWDCFLQDHEVAYAIGEGVGTVAGVLATSVTTAGVGGAAYLAARIAVNTTARAAVRPAAGEAARLVAVKSAGEGLAGVDDVLGGLTKGRNSGVRTVGSDAEIDEVYGSLTRGGAPLDVPGYKGTWIERRDGVRIGLRDASKSGGRTIDIRYPDGTTGKIHIE